nr:hypothetical protein [Pantoea sp. 201603H]
MLDLRGMLLEITDSSLYDSMREQSFFEDRGRNMIHATRVRQNSLFNRHAGIATEVNRRPSVENFFSKNTEHAKADYERSESSSTAQQFRQSGAPFITGASGTMQYIFQHLEVLKPHSKLTQEEREAAETKLLTHTAIMVAGGHHSIVEALLPGRQLGYFSDLPDPLNGKNGYRDFMRALDTRLARLNMSGGVRLSPN